MFDGKKVVLVVDELLNRCNEICERLHEKDHLAIPVYGLSNVWQAIEKVPGGPSSVNLVVLNGEFSRYVQCDNALFSPGEGGALLCALEFIRDLRGAEYMGPIMANSASGVNNDWMIEAGATHHGHGDTLHPWITAQKILDEQK